MGTTASERIALQIDTEANLGGVTAGRTAMGQFAQAAVAANNQVAKSAIAATAQQEAAAIETAQNAAEHKKLSATVEQSRTAWERSGGDMKKFGSELAKVIAEESALAVAAKQATDALAKQATAPGGSSAPSEPEKAQQITDATRQITLAQLQAIEMDRRLEASKRQLGARVTDSSRAMTLAQVQAIEIDRQLDEQRKRSGETFEKVNPKIRSGANAIAILSQAAVTGNGSMAGLAVAGGNVAQSLAAVSTNARVAAAATGIGALVVVAGLVLSAFEKADAKTKEWASDLHNLGGLSQTALGNLEASTIARIGAIQSEIDKFAARPIDIPFTKLGEKYGDDLLEQLQKYSDYLTQIRTAQASAGQAISRAAAESARQARLEITNNERTLELERERLRTQIAMNGMLTSDRAKSDLELRLQSIRDENAERKTAIDEQFRQKDAAGQIVALTNEQQRAHDKLIDQADKLAALKEREARAEQFSVNALALAASRAQSENLYQATQARLQQIEAERLADIQRLGDVAAANEIAERKKQQLYRETNKVAIDGFKAVFDAMRSGHDKTLKAIGTFGENLRRVVIGAEAAHALVKAAKEGAEAIASLAAGDFRGAALHGAAAAQFGAAAALGARESLGGGGSGGGGGGGGGVGSPAPYTPAGGDGSQSIVVNLITSNPYSGEAISAVQYELTRGNVLKRPINVPPTNGLMMAGGY